QQAPTELTSRVVEIRNEAVHMGKYPTRDQAIDVARGVAVVVNAYQDALDPALGALGSGRHTLYWMDASSERVEELQENPELAIVAMGTRAVLAPTEMFRLSTDER